MTVVTVISEPESRKWTCFSEAKDTDTSINPANIFGHPDFDSIAWKYDSTIGNSSCLIIKDENDMKWLESVNPAWYTFLIEWGIKNIILFPLKNNDKTLGYLLALNYNADKAVKIKEILELSTFLIASQIANYQLMKQLEYLGTIDILTGCKNRNAMNSTIDDIISGKVPMPDRYIVIFADLNGLKRVNDEKGHNTGDKMLRTASAILGQIFFEGDVYRAGGDEFMLIIPEMPEEDLKARFIEINEAQNEDVHFAFGYHYVESGEDVRKAMRLADERMYADKNEYYAQHPEWKYR